MSANFDYEGAIQAGYSPDEINEFLKSQPSYKPTNQKGKFFENIINNASNFFGNFGSPTGQKPQEPTPMESIDQRLLKKNKGFDVQGALESGYSPDEINEFLQSQIPEKTAAQKAGRVGAQLGLGMAEMEMLPYELSVAPLASKEAQQVPYRENLGDDIENLLMQKQSGDWTPQDEEFLQNLQAQMQDPSKSEQFIKTADLGVRALAEKATGLDLHPEGTLEKAANWIGFIKDPKKIVQAGLKPKELFKAIAPSGEELLRGAGAGTALQMAEDGRFGPMGTMAVAVLGDVAGMGAKGALKGAKNLVTKPKETLAKVAASFTSKEKLAMQKELIKDFEQAGLQADLGTITDNNLIRWTQSRLAQSGLAGDALEKFKGELTGQITHEYKALADALGEAKYASSHDAGIAMKEGIKSLREADAAIHKKMYQNADKALKEGASVVSTKLSQAIASLEKKLAPGKVKSVEQKAVLKALKKLKADIYDAGGILKFSDVKNLMNNKLGLEDIINYEVQGGAKQLLKGVVAELDRAIISHGKDNPTFAKNYVMANKQFSKHAKTFRNKEVAQMLKDGDPAKLMNRMNSVHGIRQLQNIMSKSPEGKELFNNLKRMKLDKTIGDHMVDNTTQQVKLGTFSNILKKGKNKDLIKEILGPKEFKRLELIQKNAGKLAESSNRFYNASKSGVVAADAAVLAKVLTDISALFMGSPWPLAKTIGTVMTVRKFSQLISDPEFLKLVEQVIKDSGKSDKKLFLSIEKLRPYLIASTSQMQPDDEQAPAYP
jgi:hypothetical protein